MRDDLKKVISKLRERLDTARADEQRFIKNNINRYGELVSFGKGQAYDDALFLIGLYCGYDLVEKEVNNESK